MSEYIVFNKDDIMRHVKNLGYDCIVHDIHVKPTAKLDEEYLVVKRSEPYIKQVQEAVAWGEHDKWRGGQA